MRNRRGNVAARSVPDLSEAVHRPAVGGADRRKRRGRRLLATHPAKQRSRRRLASVWTLTIPLLGGGLYLAWLTLPLGRLGGPVDVPFWVLAPAFALGEVAVVHLRFRKNAHSFSMSEVPLIIGLFSAFPPALIAAQVVGSFVALTLHRKQAAVRVAFNIAQGIVVMSTTILIFRLVATEAGALGYLGWLAALAAVVSGVSIANILVGFAILLILILKSTKAAKIIADILDRITILGYLFLALDLIGLVIILIRNLG